MKKWLLSSLILLSFALQTKAQTVIGTQDFLGGLSTKGWSAVDNNTTAGKWTWTHNPMTTENYGDLSFNSTSFSNGYAAIISDGNSSNLNTDLISQVYDCSAESYVGLKFRQWFLYGSVSTVAQILATNDGVNWTVVYDVIDNNPTFVNGELVEVDLSSVAANQSNVRIKFNYRAANDIFWAIDDIELTSLQETDAAVVSLNVADYSPVTDNYLVQCTFENKSVNRLSTITLNYSIDGADPVSATLAVSLNPFEKQDYSFSTTSHVREAGPHILAVYTSAPDNGADENPLNDTMTREINFMDRIPAKNVLLEEFSTVPCGYCPGGATFLKKAMETEGAYAIPVTMHSGYLSDKMTIPDHVTLSSAFGTGAPSAAIDRVLFPGSTKINIELPGLDQVLTNNQWKSALQDRKPYLTPMAIDASNTFNPTTRELIVNVNATFFARMKGDLRIQCYVVEDSIIGNSEYDQTSYYYDAPADVNLNPWYHDGYRYSNGVATISGYVHENVVRQFLGGTWGTAGIIPATAEADQTYSKSYTITVPNTWNTAQLSLVAFVHGYSNNYNSGKNEVVNVVRMPLNSVAINESSSVVLGIDETAKNGATIHVSPNPATDHLYVSYSFDTDAKVGFEVYNMMGQKVTTVGESKVAAGSYNTLINTEALESGVYFLTMKNNNSFVQTLKFVVSK